MFALARSKSMRKFGAVLTVMSMLLLQGSPIAAYAATASASLTVDSISDPISGSHLPTDTFSCGTNPLYNPVTVSGHGTGSAPPGNIQQYQVSIDWGDATVSTGAGTFTPNSGQGAFTFTFTGNHTYTTNGSKAITVTLYHQNASGHDNTVDAQFSFTTCIYVPPPNTATLLITKDVVNDNGGTNSPADFTIDISSSSTPNHFPGSSATTTVVVDPGAYAVTESGAAAANYTGTFSTDCSGSLVAGQTKVCHVVNNDNVVVPPAAGTLTVIKHVVNDNSGTNAAADFGITVTGGNASPSTFSGAEAPGTAVTVDGNAAYSVAETSGPTTLYGVSYSADCSGVMPAGGSKTCTITNNDNAPTTGSITITKVITNDNGGTAQVSDFTLTLTDSSAVAANVTSGASTVVTPGTFTVSESGGPTGYQGSFSGDCDVNGSVTVAAGESKTCTITNNDVAPQLTVIKHVVNDNGGTKAAADFTIHVTGTNVSSNDFAGSETGTVVTLNAGSFSVSENTVAGYTGSSSADCSGTIALGQQKTCTITNDDQQGTLIVKKVLVNNDGGTAQVTDFSFSVNGGAAVAFNANGENDLTVNAGTYGVVESAATGYATSYNNCSNVVVGNGDTQICEITNNDVAPTIGTLTVTKVIVNDNGGTAQVSDYTLSVTDSTGTTTTVVSGISKQFAPDTYTVSESGPSGYSASFSGDCDSSGHVTLATGQSKSCTITNDDNASNNGGGGGNGQDMCPNISGVQLTVPSDQKIENGLCVPNGTVTSGGGGGGGGGGNGPIAGSFGTAGGTVLGASTTTGSVLGASFGPACEKYLTKFIQKGGDNDPLQVVRLQLVLKGFENMDLTLNGIYDDATYNAVHKFQTKYAGDILAPWGLDHSTGYVYLTTRKKVNEIYCRNTVQFPLTTEEQSIVDSYKASGAGHHTVSKPQMETSGPTGGSTQGGQTETQTSNEGQAGAVGATQPESSATGNGGGFWSTVGSFLSNLFRGR